jgi:hypothetical protein
MYQRLLYLICLHILVGCGQIGYDQQSEIIKPLDSPTFSPPNTSTTMQTLKPTPSQSPTITLTLHPTFSETPEATNTPTQGLHTRFDEPGLQERIIEKFVAKPDMQKKLRQVKESGNCDPPKN